MQDVIAGAVAPASSGCPKVNDALGSAGSIGFVWAAVTNVPISVLRLAEAKLLLLISSSPSAREWRPDEEDVKWLLECGTDARVAIPARVNGNTESARRLLLAGTSLAQTLAVPFVHSLVAFILLCLTSLNSEETMRGVVEALPTVMCIECSL